MKADFRLHGFFWQYLQFNPGWIYTLKVQVKEKASKLDVRRPGYRQQAKEMYARASAVPTPDPRRLNWLRRHLQKNDILN